VRIPSAVRKQPCRTSMSDGATFQPQQGCPGGQGRQQKACNWHMGLQTSPAHRCMRPNGEGLQRVRCLHVMPGRRWLQAVRAGANPHLKAHGWVDRVPEQAQAQRPRHGTKWQSPVGGASVCAQILQHASTSFTALTSRALCAPCAEPKLLE
jgi:hypothetical protein